jgi:hypothetical protein
MHCHLSGEKDFEPRRNPFSKVSKGRSKMTISKELLDILACPKCKGDVYLNETEDGLICNACKLLYEIKDGIPIMLIDEAKPIK